MALGRVVVDVRLPQKSVTRTRTSKEAIGTSVENTLSLEKAKGKGPGTLFYVREGGHEGQ
jgi:hypothetical protein